MTSASSCFPVLTSFLFKNTRQGITKDYVRNSRMLRLCRFPFCLAGWRQLLLHASLFAASALVQAQSHYHQGGPCVTPGGQSLPCLRCFPWPIWLDLSVTSKFLHKVGPASVQSSTHPGLYFLGVTTLLAFLLWCRFLSLSQGAPLWFPSFIHLSNTYLTFKAVTQELLPWGNLSSSFQTSRPEVSTVYWAYSNHGLLFFIYFFNIFIGV